MQASVLEPIWATVRQPRFAMSFGMAFFALSVGLTVAGVKPADMQPDQPAAVGDPAHVLRDAGRVVHYYENVRFVYEVESRVREIKRNSGSRRARREAARPAKQQDNKNDTTQQPEQKQERNYSQTENISFWPALLWVHLFSDLPVVSVTTYRRFV